MHTGYFNILRRSGAGQKETTTENQRFSVVFYGLMNPLVIRVGLEPTTPTLKVLFTTLLNTVYRYHLNLIKQAFRANMPYHSTCFYFLWFTLWFTVWYIQE